MVKSVGFIGVGAMGLPMAMNIKCGLGCDVIVYDVNKESVQAAVAKGAREASSPREMGEICEVVVSMVPNDKVLRAVVTDPTTGLLGTVALNSQTSFVHVSCSTVHPDTSREMAKIHSKNGCGYVGAPVFARADGVAHRAASIVVGGDCAAIDEVMPVLESMAKEIFRFGDDPGAGNVVKLCGNFMIGAAIESCAEACSMAEKSGLDRVAVMDMLTNTIFDCLIYKGYGMRTAHRQHIPNQPMVGPGFQLELGLKDIALTRDVAAKVEAPMPFCSILHERFLASQAQGRGQMDWSALGLKASEEAGVDITGWLPDGENAADSGDSIAPM